MGKVILFISVLIEIAFAIYCIRLKSNRKKEKDILRIIEFGTFALFTVLSVITWSFQYQLFAAILLLLAIMAMVSLIRKKEDKKPYKAGRIIGKAIGMSVLLSLAIFPAILLPEFNYLLTTGEYTVGEVTDTYVDKSRLETYSNTGENRECNVEFWYPQEAKGTYPLVVFSHGTFGVKRSNITMFRELASHGYIVCSVDHPYNSFYTENENADVRIVDMGYMKQYTEWASSEDYIRSKEIMDKMLALHIDDVNFVIDTILDRVKAGDTGVYSLIDTEQIGVSGHSLGGSVALSLGRKRSDVSAVLALEAPFFGDIIDVSKERYVFTDEAYPVPMLNIYSDETWKTGILFEHSTYAQNVKYINGTYKDAFYVYITGANHLTLTDLSRTMPLFTDSPLWAKNTRNHEETLGIINDVALEFLTVI